MALDFTLIGRDGRPAGEVSIGLASWSHIMSAAADASSFPLLLRLRDYYENAHFDPAEISALISEIETMKGELLATEKTLDAMLALCQQAKVQGAPVMSIAD